MQYNSIFITIGIPTFNRSVKLHRLLKQFINLETNINKSTIEILISNNNSEDDTDNLVLSLIPDLELAGYKISYYKQPVNIGFGYNMKFLYDNAMGEYVCFFGDDDILITESFDDLINDLEKFMPAVCLSSFIQPPYTEAQRTFMFENGVDHKIVTEIGESISAIAKYPKITIYTLRKISLDNYQSAIRQVLDKNENAYAHIAYAFLCYFEGGTLLIRSRNIAKCDNEYLSIRYSPLIFANLYDAFEITLKEVNRLKYLSLINKITPGQSFLTVLRFLRKHYHNQSLLPKEVVKSDREYIKKNLHLVFQSYEHTILFLLILPYLLLKRE